MSIRDQWNSFVESREQPESEGFFSNFKTNLVNSTNSLYQQLPIYENEETAQQEPSFLQMSQFEKIIGFIVCLLASAFFFGISFVLFPVLAVKPRKFGLLWSLGSLMFIVAFAILNGPVAYLKHMVSKDRIYFSAFFVGTVMLTIYFSIVVKSVILTFIFGILELIAVVYYTVSYFPFGAQALSMITSTSGRQLLWFVGYS